VAPLDPTAASRAVLIDVSNVLGAFRSDLVIVGGWVPELLYPNRGHIGTLDVDLAVRAGVHANNPYQSILKRLTDAGYTHQASPTRFVKSVLGTPEPVKVDLICGQNEAGESGTVQMGELQLSCLRGVELAFIANKEIEVSGPTPDGPENRVRVWVVRPEAYILIKAFALAERKKTKDAYDVAFVLANYEPSLADLAARVRTLLGHELAREGFQILKDKFATFNSVGPDSAAREQQSADPEQARRAAFEDAGELFRLVDGGSTATAS
jgi:hypothetical protein